MNEQVKDAIIAKLGARVGELEVDLAEAVTLLEFARAEAAEKGSKLVAAEMLLATTLPKSEDGPTA